MKKTEKIKSALSFLAAVLLTVTVFSLSASAETEFYITVRVEAPDSNIYFNTFTVPYEGTLTVKQALEYLDDQTDDVNFTGLSDGKIYAVNDIGEGLFGGRDGWHCAVNDVEISAGIDYCELSNGSHIAVFYGSESCQVPIIDASKLDCEGIISFISYDTIYYGENSTPTNVVNKVVGATVTANGIEYITDENGEIKIPFEDLNSWVVRVQIDRRDENGAPNVLRFAPDKASSVWYNNFDPEYLTTDTDTDASTDTSTDTDKDIDADINTDTSFYTSTETDTDKSTSTSTDTDTDTTSDTEKNTDSDSNTSSKTSSTTGTTSTSNSSKTTTTSGSTTTTSMSAVETAQPGESAMLPACIFMIAAASFVIIALVLVCLEK